ncbi:KRAB-A domain-containing protein 2-like [Gossypium australe]|uniref:KRAB-A domain-containing protein 2-like n=1 Tax=Gossypium australe TaxID=47621 RepID=A0A5B6X479_9ROSI|nr:KRAB-A domain-containing protein 2-like [Gossypium australe]
MNSYKDVIGVRELITYQKGTKCRKQYILMAVDYVSKWVEAISPPTNDTKSVVRFLRKNIFSGLVLYERWLVTKDLIYVASSLK